MSGKHESTEPQFIPGSLSESSEIFDFPFTEDDCTMEYLKEHGRIMFIIRGPPGTGKDSLSKMLTDQYPTATICSADAYFGNTFSSFKRDSQSLRLSHEFCHSLVKNACQSNSHPIIVKNTHMKKFEMQKYLDFAAEYNYTVIMAVTLHKFKVTPEILARSNTKGLSVEYFERRLKQWEEVIPLLVGWFLNPEDSSYLLNELQKSLDSLLGDGKFCRILNIFENDGLFKHYKARKLLYCIAACGENNRCNEIRSYYLSKKVQENYGKCFTITILGYLVTPSFVSAVVYLNENQKSLRYTQKSSKRRGNSIDSLVKGFSSLDLEGNLKKHCATIDLDVDFKSTKGTAKQEKKFDDEVINISHCSPMLLAESDEIYSPAKSVDSFFQLLNGAADVNGVIRSDQLIELDENMKVYRFSEDAWLIKPPFELSFKSIYTGLYV